MKNIIPVFFLVLAFISCTKEVGVSGHAGPQGPPGLSGTGAADDTASISGQLDLYNEFSLAEGTAAGVIVTLTDGILQVTDTTDSAGRYHFPGIKTGTYNLTYQKAGYGTMMVYSLSHFGGGAAPTSVQSVTLTQIPVKTAPISLSISNNNGSTVFSIILDTSSLSYVQYYMNFELFISTSKKVSSSNYMYEVGYTSPDGNGGYMSVLDKSDPMPFQYGDTLYAAVYTYNRYIHFSSDPASDYMDVGNAGFYADPQTGMFIYPNLSKPSNILQFVF